MVTSPAAPTLSPTFLGQLRWAGAGGATSRAGPEGVGSAAGSGGDRSGGGAAGSGAGSGAGGDASAAGGSSLGAGLGASSPPAFFHHSTIRGDESAGSCRCGSIASAALKLARACGAWFSPACASPNQSCTCASSSALLPGQL